MNNPFKKLKEAIAPKTPVNIQSNSLPYNNPPGTGIPHGIWTTTTGTTGDAEIHISNYPFDESTSQLNDFLNPKYPESMLLEHWGSISNERQRYILKNRQLSHKFKQLIWYSLEQSFRNELLEKDPLLKVIPIDPDTLDK